MPLSTTVGHLVEHLLAPPGDRHVERIVAAGLGGLVVPHLQRFEQRLAGRRQAEVDHHRGAARKRCARAALEIVGRIGAHERHFEMGVRVDAARHDVAAGGVELVVGVQVRCRCATILPCLISTSAFQVRSAVTMVPFLMTLDIFFPYRSSNRQSSQSTCGPVSSPAPPSRRSNCFNASSTKALRDSSTSSRSKTR